jgi:hypothetical protein
MNSLDNRLGVKDVLKSSLIVPSGQLRDCTQLAAQSLLIPVDWLDEFASRCEILCRNRLGFEPGHSLLVQAMQVTELKHHAATAISL